VAETEAEELAARAVEGKCAVRLDSVGESSFGAHFEKRLVGCRTGPAALSVASTNSRVLRHDDSGRGGVG